MGKHADPETATEHKIHLLVQHLDRTPRLIVWVTPSPREIRHRHDELLANDSLRGWTLKLVDQYEDYKLLEADAKLVISSGDLFAQWNAVGFRGPTLALSANGPDTAREILAATLAMEPTDDLEGTAI